MNAILRGMRAFGAFWWDFIVGDDWRIAAGVIVAIAVTAALAHDGLSAWWFLPVAVLALLALSLADALRTARQR